MSLLNADANAAEIARLIAAAGQTVVLQGGAGTPIKALREMDTTEVGRMLALEPDNEPIVVPSVWYVSQSDYLTHLQYNPNGKQFTHRGVGYRIKRIAESEDGDTLVMARLLCDRDGK